MPWLEPDINDHLAALAAAGTTSVVVSPIGFISDHLEVVWDLDTEAAGTAKSLGLEFARAATPGDRPTVRADGAGTGARSGCTTPARGGGSASWRCGTPAPGTAAVPGRRSGAGWTTVTERKPIEAWLTDMDGVLVHEGQPIPGAPEFIERLRESGKPFLVLTNNSIYTPRDLHARLRRMGLDVPEERDLDLGAGHRAVPRRPAAGRHRVRASARPG